MAKDVTYTSANSLRCNVPLAYLGTRDFHEGTRWGVFGEIAELFVNKESFELYACPRCGHVEFFVEGVGEELRQPQG
jgi:hypothetical protein